MLPLKPTNYPKSVALQSSMAGASATAISFAVTTLVEHRLSSHPAFTSKPNTVVQPKASLSDIEPFFLACLAACAFMLLPRKQILAAFVSTIVIQAAPASRGRISTVNHILFAALAATLAKDTLAVQGACLLLAVPQLFRKRGESILGRDSARHLRVAAGPAVLHLLCLDAVRTAAPVQIILACLFSLAVMAAPAAGWPPPPHGGARVHGLMCRVSSCALLAAFVAQAGPALLPAIARLPTLLLPALTLLSRRSRSAE